MRLINREKKIRARFPHRDDLSYEELWAQHFPSLPREQVVECLKLFELEYHITTGFLRPDDSLTALFAPVPTWNPIKWLMYRGIESDGRTELSHQLERRFPQQASQGLLELRTFGDYVSAWCGQ